jgi:hypothetical protein
VTGAIAGAAVLGLFGATLLLHRVRARRRHLRRRLHDPTHPPEPEGVQGLRHAGGPRRRAACAQVTRVAAELANDARTGRPLDLSTLPRPLDLELHAASPHDARDEVALLAFALRVAAVPGASRARVLAELVDRLEARAAADQVARGMVRAAHAGLAVLALGPLAAWIAGGARADVAPWAWLGTTFGLAVALRPFNGREHA